MENCMGWDINGEWIDQSCSDQIVYLKKSDILLASSEREW